MTTMNNELLDFLNESPTCFHAISNMRKLLEENGFIELYEGSKWNLEENKNYFVVRNESSLIAFKVPETKDFNGFMISASHSDSPCFKVKENPEMVSEGIVKLNVERYGGMLLNPWFDRPLSVAGRLIVKKDGCFATRLVNIDEPFLVIPNVAIHMNRKANDGYKNNAQVDMLPVFGEEKDAKGTFLKTIAEYADLKEDEILGHDLFVYPYGRGCLWGKNKAFMSSPRLDDLQCAFGCLKGFLNATPTTSCSVFACFDNEEVGSGTKQGADSTFLEDTLIRISNGCNKTKDDYYQLIASSFMVSADNAHAAHPNHAELADPTNKPHMNEGVVIKYNANQKYTTDAVSASILKDICKHANVPVQEFTNRSDMPGGSTLGNISNAHVSLNTVDIGLAQLAMHSTYETCGTKDTAYLVDLMSAFFASSIKEEGKGMYRLNK